MATAQYLLLAVIVASCSLVQAMEPHFYDHSCPSAEATVYSIVQDHYRKDKFIAPNLIRLLLHDCFVGGCDASILLKSDPHSNIRTERDALPNQSLQKSFDLVEEIKYVLETKCPGVVSCADIIAIASRDAVNLLGGQYFDLLLGRHDGMVSKEEEALQQLPDMVQSVEAAMAAFKAKGFTEEEFVALMGAHSVGTTDCAFVVEQVNGTTPLRTAGTHVQEFCRRVTEVSAGAGRHPGLKRRVSLDPAGSTFELDGSYFREIVAGHGVLGVDRQLATHPQSEAAVQRFSRRSEAYFQTYFQHSFKKLGLVEVLGHGGEIRVTCSRLNNNAKGHHQP